MALRARQVKWYLERATIYRPNKVKGAAKQITYSVLSTDVVCKLFTTPNFDRAKAGIAQTKEGNVFTDNILHMDPTQDIRAEDVVLMTTSLNCANRPWFRVGGDPETRQGVADRTAAYLQPIAGLKPSVIV